MSGYSCTTLQQYNSAGQAVAFSSSGGTTVDAENDDLFDTGDAGPPTFFFENRTTYVGTITIAGGTFQVFEGVDASGSVYIIVATGTDDSGSRFDPSTINTGATFPICFFPGTGIATPTGERAVEDLAIGDVVQTQDGRHVPITWIGRQSLFPTFNPSARRTFVQIAQGALGDGLPARDPPVTADHALLLDGLLVNAGALVNGGTIALVPKEDLGGSYAVYRIETEAHDIIRAEGTPAETYIDYAARKTFDNCAEYLALYGDDPSTPREDLSAGAHGPDAARALENATGT